MSDWGTEKVLMVIGLTEGNLVSEDVYRISLERPDAVIKMLSVPTKILSLDVRQDCCLGLAVRLTMATSRFLSLTYCQLVGASTLGSHRLWSPWQRH